MEAEVVRDRIRIYVLECVSVRYVLGPAADHDRELALIVQELAPARTDDRGSVPRK